LSAASSRWNSRPSGSTPTTARARHHFTISNPLNAAMGNERVKGLGGGKKAVSKGGSQSWEKFLREHPDREIK